MGYVGVDAVESWKLEQQNQNLVLFSYLFDKLYDSHSRSNYLSTILLKCFHLFKIVESAYN